MSQENVEVVRLGIEAFNSGDVNAILTLADTEVEWRPAFGAATGGATAYHGHAGIVSLGGAHRRSSITSTLTPSNSSTTGISILVIGRGTGRAKGSGIQIDQPFAMLWKVLGGKAVFGQTFTDPDQARAAAERLAQERG